MKKRPVSIQSRLAWRLSMLAFAVLALAVGGFAYHASKVANTLRDDSLRTQAHAIATHLSVDQDGSVRLQLPDVLRNAYAQSGNGYFFAVLGRRDRVLATSSRDIVELLGPMIPSGTAARYFRVDVNAPTSPYYGYITSSGGLRIVVAQGTVHDDALADSLMEEFFEGLLWWIVPVMLIATLIGVMTIRSSLAPLKALSETAIAIGPATTDSRLSEDGVPVEVLPMVRAVNGALDRLEKGFSAQRRFTADAAHQLRTPVALLQARIDSANTDGADLEGLRGDIARIHRVIAQLLRVARLDAMQADLSAEVELGAMASDTLADLAPLALRQGRKLALERASTPVLVRGSRELLEDVLTNLVENAMAHAPRGSTVTVRIEADGTLEVLDEGPGVKGEFQEAVFERFWRPPGSATSGAGLGLAIVADIARLHGGSVAVRKRPGGGAAFAMTLPVLGGPPNGAGDATASGSMRRSA